MRFSTRLTVSLLALLGLGAILAATLTFEARAEVRSDARLARTIEPALRNVERVGRRYVSLQNNVRGYLLTGDDSFLTTFTEIDGEIDTLLGEIEVQLGSTVDGTDELLTRLADTERAWQRDAVQPELDMYADGRQDELRQFVASGVPNDSFAAVLTAWGDLRTAVDSELTEVRLARTGSLRDLSLLGVSLVAFGIFGALVLAVWLRRTVLQPLGTLVASSQRLLAGDRETPVGDITVPEFRPLAEALDTMRREVDAMIDAQARASVLVALEEQLAEVANDLHDDPVQTMTVALMRVHRLTRLVDPAHAEMVETAEDAIASAVQRLRRFTFALHPTGLADDGLAATIRTYVRLELDEADAPDVEVLGEAPPSTSPEMILVAFRITREAVVNSIRHAEASRVSVELRDEDGWFVIEVHDDGRGFDPSVTAPGHRGLVAMRHLARTCGGTVEVESGPAGGTRVIVRLPERTTATGADLALVRDHGGR